MCKGLAEGAYRVHRATRGARVALTRSVAHDSRTSGLVLIADDDVEVRIVLALHFAAAGFDVATASDGAEMIALLETLRTPTAILLDLVMPGVLGTSVLEYLRNEPRLARVPTALVTAFPGVAPPGVRVFTKPARLVALLRFVRDAEGSTRSTSQALVE